MQHVVHCTALILVLATFILAETRIAGDIHAMNLDETGNPYIVEQDIFVPAGKKAEIKEGCIFLFKNFTGLNVQGQISVTGTAAKPVVFTSVNDGDLNPQSEQLPNSFDWNGILLTRESQGAVFKNIQLKYSVYGIKAQNPGITISNGSFYQNGQFHFTINDKIQTVQDNVPFSYDASNPGSQSSQTTQNSSAGSTSAPHQSAQVIAQPKRKTSTSTLAVRYSCLGIGVIGIGAGVVYTLFINQDNTDMTAIKSDMEKNLTTGPESQARWKNLETKLNADKIGAIIGYSVGALGLVGFGVTFVF